MSVGWTLVALSIPTVVAFVCVVVADGRQDPTPETWDNGRVTYGDVRASRSTSVQG